MKDGLLIRPTAERRGPGFDRRLAGIALAAAAVYCGLLVREGWHHATGGLPVDLPSHVSGFHPVRIAVNASFVVLMGVYLAWLVPVSTAKAPLPALLRQASPFLALAWLAYPVTHDLYLYLHYGLMGLGGVNPYRVSAGEFPSDLAYLIHWRRTSTYGPVSESVFMVAALAARYHLLAGVYAYKALCLAAHVLNACLIWRLLDPTAFRSKLTMAYLINPCLLSMQVTEGHLDVFMCTWVILLAGCLRRGQYVGAVAALWGGALTKTLPILFGPLLAAELLGRRKWRDLAIGALLSAGVVGLLTATLFPTPESWKTLLDPGASGRYARSIYQAISLVLDQGFRLSYEGRAAAVSRLILVGTGVFLGYLAAVAVRWYLKPAASGADRVADLGWLSVALLLLATPWMMPWYPTVLIPLGILSGARFFGLCSLVFSLSANLIYGDGAGFGLVSLITGVSTLGPVVAVLLLRRRLEPLCEAWAREGPAGTAAAHLGPPAAEAGQA